MSEKVVIQLETLTRLADGFRESRGIANNLTTEQMIALAQEPIKPEQEKTIDITENGITEIPADEGYTLSKVTANVNVAATAENKLPQLIDRSITEITAEDLDGVTQIKGYTFYQCRSLINITIPNTVTKIEQCAFYECKNLSSIIIPDSVADMSEDYTFAYCKGATNLTIGTGLTKLGDYSFYSCKGLTNVIIPDNITELGSSVFANCDNLENVILSNNITIITSNAFTNCFKLTNLILPNNITVINNSAFRSCTSLANLTIPTSVSSIGSSALQIGHSSNKATITFLSTTPPTISSSTFLVDVLDKIIVPAGSGEAYRTATNWANFADYIEEAVE